MLIDTHFNCTLWVADSSGESMSRTLFPLKLFQNYQSLQDAEGMVNQRLVLPLATKTNTGECYD